MAEISNFINHVAEQFRGFAIYIYERRKMSKKARIHCLVTFLGIFDDFYRNFDSAFKPIIKRLLNTTTYDLSSNAANYYTDYIELLKNINSLPIFEPVIKSLNILRMSIFNNYAYLYVKLKYDEIIQYVNTRQTLAVNLILCLRTTNEYKMVVKIGNMKKLIWRMNVWLSIHNYIS